MEYPKQIGKYELEEYIGGRMALVFRAKDTELNRVVALRVLAGPGSANLEARSRFFQEARLASEIRHENIIGTYDYGEDEGLPFVAMEFVEGETLSDAIRNNTTGDSYNRMRLAVQAARALEHLHALKIIHRDLKPENLHVDNLGKVRLMDIGIAKAPAAALNAGLGFGQTGDVVGTPYYAAPEQVVGWPLTPHVDVYAFGALLYELMTGERMVKGRSMEQVFRQILYEKPSLAPLRNADLPPDLSGLITRCTSKQLTDRPATLAAVREELEGIFANAPVPPPPEPLPPVVAEPEPEPEVEAPPPPPPPPTFYEVMMTRMGNFFSTPLGMVVFAAGVVLISLIVLAGILELAGIL